MTRKKKTHLLSALDQVVACIECEMEIVSLELEHPEKFTATTIPITLAKWNGTMSEVLEFVIALYLTGRIRKLSGQQMNLAEVAGLFGEIFGMKLSDLYGRKSKLLTRKKNESPFLDSLTFLYREEVEKMGL